MNVLVDSSVFAGALVAEDLRLRLLAFNIEGRHRVFVANDSPAFNTWLSQQSARFREAWDTSVQLVARETARNVPVQTIRVTLPPEWDPSARIPLVDIERAVSLLAQPLKLYLESINSDGDFLNCVAKLGGRRPLLDKYCSVKWLEFAHGGGLGELETQLKRKLREDPLARLRTWVLFDSDALRPNNPSREPRNLGSFCVRRSLRFHCLRRRAIENYLPSDSLRYWAEEPSKLGEKDERKKRQRTYSNLRDDQRFHFNMKEGLYGDRNRADLGERVDPVTQRDLYDDLEPAAMAALQRGFGGSISERFRTDSRITETLLRSDGQQPEIGSMLDEIFSLI